MPKDLPSILRDNVRRILALPEGKSGVGVLIELGLKNGTAQRVLAGETSIGLELLAVLAEKLRVAPWQLLVPGLDPRALPSLGKNPNLKPGAAHVVACMDQMDDSGVDVMVKMADALIRPPASSLAMPTTPQPQTQ